MAKFKPRARSLDLLGRQQIAGVPTALNELFKNAYDAYAENVEVDFFRKSNQLLLRDDGIGMSLEDFENRWLTIGTESKLDTKSGISKPVKDPSKPIRPVMGEKGIGRLAIAAIGPQVLVLTRSRKVDSLGNYVLAFINWSMFELPGLDLDEIEIPVRTYQSIDEINTEEVHSLVKLLKDNLISLKDKTDLNVYQRALQEISEFKFNPKILSLEFGPSISNGGTHFIIQPIDSGLVGDIEVKSDDLVSELHQMLSGFSNTMLNENAPIKTAFRDHRLNGDVPDLIGKGNFFTPEEYAKTDHHIQGEFDEFGNFKGKLSVYHMKEQDVEFIFNKTGKPLLCGPFKFSFGFLQGNLKDSLLDKHAHTELAKKCNTMGGVYVYRDDIRILPYGRPDVDFLGIERRRNLRASTYMFNHRRLIGAIELTRSNNAALVEKAGREGFMSNLAYRQFRNTLEEFLVRLAQEFFLEDQAYSDEYIDYKKRLNTEYDILQRRNKSVSQKKKKLEASLNDYFKKIEENVNGENSTWLDLEIISILNETHRKVAVFLETTDIDIVADQIIEFEGKILNRLHELETKLTVNKPRGIGLSKNTARLYLAYERTKTDIVERKISAAESQVMETISDLSNTARLHLDAKIRLEQSIHLLKTTQYKKLDAEEKGTISARKSVNKFIDEIKQNNKKSKADLELAIDKKIAEVNQDASNIDITKVRNELETDVEKIASDMGEKYSQIRYALEEIIKLDDPDGEINDGRTIQAMETRMEALQEEYQDNLENIQLGLAIKIINHEFSSNIKGVRDSIKSLKKWSNSNKDLKGLYDRIRDGFDHLDNYLNLFTPLEKRMHRRKAVISGSSIHEFIIKLYEERFERHEVKLEVTDTFKKHIIESYASTLYPVFINLIDNSIYWLSTMPIKSKQITLDANEDRFIIADNGPGISERDRENIYDFGYSRKVNGGGMGLYIAKTTLNKEGLDIFLTPSAANNGTEFFIGPKDGELNE